MDSAASVRGIAQLTPVFRAAVGRQGAGVEERRETAKRAAMAAFLVLVGFALAGALVFRVLGITIPAFKIAGGIMLLLIAVDMIRTTPSPARITEPEVEAGVAKEDVAIVPLAMPLLAGPGSIATVIVLMGRTRADVLHVESMPYDFVDRVDESPGMLRLRTAAGVKSPVEVSAEILRVLRDRAEEALGGELVGAVVTEKILEVEVEVRTNPLPLQKGLAYNSHLCPRDHFPSRSNFMCLTVNRPGYCPGNHESNRRRIFLRLFDSFTTLSRAWQLSPSPVL